jgi:hypothetical protein
MSTSRFPMHLRPAYSPVRSPAISFLSVTSLVAALPEHWFALPMTVGLATAAGDNQGVSFLEYLLTPRENVPEVEGLLVFFLIGQCVFADALEERHGLGEWTRRKFSIFLAATDAERDFPIDPAMLALTKEFAVFDSPAPIDLLAEFLPALHRAVQRGWVSEDAVTGRVREYVKGLINLRDASPTTM